MEARKAIECITAKMAALNRSTENLEAMAKVIDLRVDSKEEFYRKLLICMKLWLWPHRIWFSFILSRLFVSFIFQTYSNLTLEENDIELVMKTHYAIYNSIKNRDPEEAEKAMINDLEAYRKLYHEVIKNKLSR